MRGEVYEPHQMYVTLTLGVEDGDVVGYQAVPGTHSYVQTAEFWDSLASLALDMKDMIEKGPVERREGDVVW